MPLGLKLNILRELIRRWVSRTCRRSDLVIGVSESVMKPYVDEARRGIVVRNCAPQWFGDAPLEGVVTDDENELLRVMHGKAIPTNGTPRVLDTLEALSEPLATRLRVHMTRSVGGVDSPFVRSVEQRLGQMTNGRVVDLVPGIPHGEMPALLRAHDVGMVAYGRDLGVDSLPNRLFEYMAAGLAILAPEYAVEINRIVTDESIGLLADFEDPADVAAKIGWLIEHPEEVHAMGERARGAFLRTYNWDSEFAGLLETMKAIEKADAQ